VEEDGPALCWQDDARWSGDICDRESFRFPLFLVPAGRPEELYGSLYYAKPSRPRQCLVVLPHWGHEGRFSLEWCHKLASGAASLRANAMVLHWPGTEDSDGDASEVTLELLVDAVLSSRGVLAGRFGKIPCSVAGFGLGGTVAALAQARGGFYKTALVQPVLDPDRYFQTMEARARLSWARGVPHRGWGFGDRVPAGLKAASPTAVQESLQAARSTVAVIRDHSTEPLPPAVQEIAVHMKWPRPAGWDNGALRRETLRFLCGRAPRSVM